MSIEMKQGAIVKAIEETSFDELQSQDLKAGFKEETKNAITFSDQEVQGIGQRN